VASETEEGEREKGGGLPPRKGSGGFFGRRQLSRDTRKTGVAREKLRAWSSFFKDKEREHHEKNAGFPCSLKWRRITRAFNRSVKIVMQESGRGRLKNIHGPVSRS
jgi:hypothetical protein